jgi:hypothetical protein
VPYATERIFVTFTAARRGHKTTAMEFNDSPNRPNGQGITTVTTLQDRTGQRPANLDAAIRARACHALQAVLKSRPRQRGPRIMPKGAERC